MSVLFRGGSVFGKPWDAFSTLVFFCGLHLVFIHTDECCQTVSIIVRHLSCSDLFYMSAL